MTSLGEQRKQTEIALHKHFLDATPDQVAAIRRLAPDVVEGTISYEQALERIEAV